MSNTSNSKENSRNERIHVVSELRDCFKKDRSTVYYKGAFTDSFTDRVITLAEFELERKTRRRMAFFVAESFQNIVRHGADVPEKDESSLFGVRSIGSYLHIYSSNLVEEADKEIIEKSLKKIESLNSDELDEYYRHSLMNNELSAKGGAGLGFVSMVRRSKHPVQHQFVKKGELYSFNLQIDFKNDSLSKESDQQPMSIEENSSVYDRTLEYDISFLYNGDFSDDMISSMLSIIEETNNTETNSAGFQLYHAAVEMMQNVVRHGKEEKDGNDGIFAILNTKDGYYMCSGNYIKKEGLDIVQKVESLNLKTKDELNELYRSTLKKNVLKRGNNAGIGLIDLKRTIDSKIDIIATEDNGGHYLMMGLEIKV
jgi:anti-sigma regulatory factor (Ser/Thr protein kinase)